MSTLPKLRVLCERYSQPSTNRPLLARRRFKVKCISNKTESPGNALAQLSVAVLTEGLRVAGVGAQEYQQAAACTNAVRPLQPGDVRGVQRALRRDFERNQYFVTGVLTDAIYDEDCIFIDPTIRFQGRDLWKRNLQLLVPFLMDPQIKLKFLQRLPPQQQQPGNKPETSAALAFSWLPWQRTTSAESTPVQLYAEWLLTCYVALPWRPYVAVNGTTTFTLNDDSNQVVKHVEAWDISGLEALLLLLRPSDRAVWKRGNT